MITAIRPSLCRPVSILFLTVLAAAGLSGSLTAAEGVRDARHGPLKDLNGDFSFEPPASREAWETRAAQVRRQAQVALGLWPMPERTPLEAVIHGKRELEGYSVEKVYFQAMPGFFVTGTLYRPAGVSGPVPGVLCPHGHWPDGRFMRESDEAVARQLATGAETDESAARNPLQARCVHLARMGCVVFHYDMIGYADSEQLSLELAHRFKAQRPEMNAPEEWGFFSPQAEGRLQSIMGLQTWSGVRALDFLTSLPDVDPERLGVTGASGGATQTFLLAAVDPRPAAIFPAVMVSTAMQGGCTCENASLLRIGTGNVELAALFAPKPAGFTAADDWTKEFSTKGYPQLQSVYQLFGVPENVTLLSRTEFPHNYNQPSRMAMYHWLARHLKTPRPAPAAETSFVLLAKADLTVWDETHPAPAAGDPEFERKLLRQWDADTARQVAARPELIDGALPVLAGRTWAEAVAGPFSWKPDPARTRADAVQRIAGTLTSGPDAESVRIVFLYPDQWSGKVLIRLEAESEGREGTPEILTLLQSGTAVAFPTLFSDPGASSGKIRRVAGDRDFLGYTAGYNPPPVARRAQDLLQVLAWMSQYDPKPSRIEIEAAGPLVPEAALALTQVPAKLVAKAVFGATDFRFAALTDVFDARLLPGAVRYGDLPALLRRVKADEVVTGQP